jgi:hypothetical protein
LTAARAIRDEGPRAQVLTGLAPHLPETERVELLLTLIQKLSSFVQSDNLGQLIATWQAGDFARLQAQPAFWSVVLRALSHQPRSALVKNLGALAPVINYMGGPAAVAETIRAMRDVAAWWP